MVGASEALGARAVQQLGGERALRVRFSADGQRQFHELTQRTVGKMVAVVVDERVILAATMREPVAGGAFNVGPWVQEAQPDPSAWVERMAAGLRSGPLTGACTVLEIR